MKQVASMQDLQNDLDELYEACNFFGNTSARGKYADLFAYIEWRKEPMSEHDFAEILMDEGWFSDVFSDMFWSREYSTDRCLTFLQAEASRRGHALLVDEDWDVDEYFYNAYRCDSDKSLS